ncbi:MAG: 30S ribosome-binding factor RbfA [Flavobacteriales bacterium]|nr:30S ribosome-binding factor RbfA [Flavobacteriales bacterium]
MASIRQEKVSELIKRELAVIFQRESRTMFNGMFITVTKCRISPDLGNAKAYLSFMAVEDTDKAIETVQSQVWKIRKMLAEGAGKALRRTPDLNFFVDDSLDYYDTIDELLK